MADDEPAILALVTARLEQAGYRTCHARIGWEAIEGVWRYAPAAVRLDINMGGMDGFAVLKGIKAHPSTARTPVLMLTARGAAEDVDGRSALGPRTI